MGTLKSSSYKNLDFAKLAKVGSQWSVMYRSLRPDSFYIPVVFININPPSCCKDRNPEIYLLQKSLPGSNRIMDIWNNICTFAQPEHNMPPGIFIDDGHKNSLLNNKTLLKKITICTQGSVERELG